LTLEGLYFTSNNAGEEAHVNLIREIASEIRVRPRQVEEAVKLLDAGNTIPFIARYRKEVTGELDEEQLRNISSRLTYLRNLESRKEEVIKSLTELDKLTPELQVSITASTTLQEVEDIYRPFRPKRKTRASVAREKGLDTLAQRLKDEADIYGDPLRWAEAYVDPERGVDSPEAAIAGAMDIIAEEISDDPDIRRLAREYVSNEGKVMSELKDGQIEEAKEFLLYHKFAEAIKRIPPHRILAINRGEKLNLLKVYLEVDEGRLRDIVERRVVLYPEASAAKYLIRAMEDGIKRLLFPSLEREIRSSLTECAEEQAIRIFGINLRHLLLQPPIKGRRILGIDPGFRTGCKIAVIDQTGRLITTSTMYPHPPQNQRKESLELILRLVNEENVTLIAIGNGTASRETELLVAEALHMLDQKVEYCIVSEAGASVYSASPLARKEFPELDVAMRGAVSIARRLLDPLAELVKIEPRSIGVGQYQHDVNVKDLESALAGVVESCVNFVGVDLNTASPSLLKYVAGIGPSLAQKIVTYREGKGCFLDRTGLRKVSGLGDKAFTQAAGFIRVPESINPLDNTPVHPESYPIAERLLQRLSFSLDDLRNRERLISLRETLKTVKPEDIAVELDAGIPTLRDIMEALGRPGRDPRESLPPPVLRQDVMKMEDLQVGMELSGTVRNVVDFGAFVDIGVKQDGLVHISELSEGFVRHPSDKVAVGDIVRVKILSVDHQRGRISLTMKNYSA
jgi:uncharacterized protein